MCGTAPSASVMGWIERCTGSQKAGIPLASRPDTRPLSCVCAPAGRSVFKRTARHAWHGLLCRSVHELRRYVHSVTYCSALLPASVAHLFHACVANRCGLLTSAQSCLLPLASCHLALPLPSGMTLTALCALFPNHGCRCCRAV